MKGNYKMHRIPKKLARLATRSVALLAVGVIASVATAVAAAAVASSSGGSQSTAGPSPATAFSVLSEPAAAGTGVPAGAVRAATTERDEIYVWAAAATGQSVLGSTSSGSGEICLMNKGADGASGSSCSPESMAIKHGIVDVHRTLEPTPEPTTVVVLVPNGVRSVTFTNRNGSTNVVTVANNVAVVEDDNLASAPATAVSYTLPDGTVEALPMPAGEPTAGP
jgi:hypothetical protein